MLATTCEFKSHLPHKKSRTLYETQVLFFLCGRTLNSKFKTVLDLKNRESERSEEALCEAQQFCKAESRSIYDASWLGLRLARQGVGQAQT